MVRGHVPTTPNSRRLWTWFVSLIAVVGLLGSACASSESAEEASVISDAPSLSDDAVDAEFRTRGSVEQVAVTHAEPGIELALYDSEGNAVDIGVTDEQGSLLFRLVAPGSDYQVATTEGTIAASEPVEVVAVEDSTPDQSFYDDQELVDGYQYITTRDGTTLAASVFLPGPIEDGPYPTVIEYSGYSPAKPATNLLEARWDELSKQLPDGLTLDAVCQLLPTACDTPDQPVSMVASALGYAVVGVNIRGTGCSGGAYDFFEPLQLLDGYDIVETVAAQDWVANNKVAMVGLSYPGISQLFVASTQPPSLAAIAPMSVYDDTARGVLAPGGIFNEGFALTWAEMVLDSAVPYGQGWEQDLVDAGDEECRENQLLRGQNVDAVSKAKDHPFYDPEVADPLNISLLAPSIDVPVYLTGAFQDEQTGGRFPLLFNEFTNSPDVKFTMWNGAHADSLRPESLVGFKTFLDFYLVGELTPRDIAMDLFLGVVMSEAFGVSPSFPAQNLYEDYDSFEDKLAAYQAEPPITIHFESGAGDPSSPGAPVSTFVMTTSEWPPTGVTPTTWYFHADGTLASTEPAESGEVGSTFAWLPELGSKRTFNGDNDNDLFRADVELNWENDIDGGAVVMLSNPLAEDIVMVGSARVDLFIKSMTGEADIGVTLSEVRPDGQEVFIQTGSLRATHRALSDDATELWPQLTNLEADSSPLPEGEYEPVSVEIFPFAHIFRAGSQIRVSVHTPGGNKTRWSYILADQPEGTTYDIGHSSDLPSSVTLPVIPGISGYPSEYPVCTSLRAQPCRTFVPYTNTPAKSG